MSASFPTLAQDQAMPQQQLLALYQAGRHHEVVAQAQAQAISAETNPLAANIVAASLFQLGEYARAASLLEALEAPLGDQRDYLSLYGATCRRLGLLPKAEQLLARALQLDPASLEVRNNYANLLIDLGRDQEARSILEQLLRERPGYEDARANLNRLEFRQQPVAAPPASAQPWSPADPLMMAFADEEVRQAQWNQPAAVDPAAKALAAALPQPEAQAMAADQLRLASQAVSEGNAAFALQLCGQALAGLGANASVYVNASDAYIRNQRFREAEICLLHAALIGGPNINTYINLVSLASLRGDLALASHYLDQAAGLDPSHPQLSALQANLRQREADLASRPYQFEVIWPDQQLQSVGV